MNRPARKTKIVATIGPSSDSPEVLTALIKGGMNVARLNFSHGTHAIHHRRIQHIREVAHALNRPIAIMLDTKGPEIRTGLIQGDSTVLLTPGMEVALTTERLATNPNDTPLVISIGYAHFLNYIEVGSHIYIADGIIKLQVLQIAAPRVRCLVCTGGVIGSRKNVNIPGVSIPLPIISDRDKEDIRWGIENKVDFIAASFVCSAEDIFVIRRYMGSQSPLPSLIAKIENQSGVDNIEEIARASYGVMVARGDLGVQLPLEDIPVIQKNLIATCNALRRPVITATQLLESMTGNARPTRAEMSDVANAIFDGTDALMLSAETASGRYPVESVATLDTLARTTEQSSRFRNHAHQQFYHATANVGGGGSMATARAAYIMAREVDASAIIVPSLRGNSPRLLSAFRAPQPILAIGTSGAVMHKLQLDWGIIPLRATHAHTDQDMIQNAIDVALAHNHVHQREWVIVAAGLPLSSNRPFNTVSSHYLASIVARGRDGLGGSCSAPVYLLKDAPHSLGDAQLTDAIIDKITNKIVVVSQLNATHIPLIATAAGIISERRALVNLEQVLAHNPSIVIIDQVPGVTSQVSQGQRLILNGYDKTIYTLE